MTGNVGDQREFAESLSAQQVRRHQEAMRLEAERRVDVIMTERERKALRSAFVQALSLDPEDARIDHLVDAIDALIRRRVEMMPLHNRSGGA